MFEQQNNNNANMSFNTVPLSTNRPNGGNLNLFQPQNTLNTNSNTSMMVQNPNPTSTWMNSSSTNMFNPGNNNMKINGNPFTPNNNTQGNLFSANNNTNLFQANNQTANFGVMNNNSTSQNPFTSSSSSGGMMTRSMAANANSNSNTSIGQIRTGTGTTGKKFEMRVLKDGWSVHSINAMMEYSNKCLDELRAEDYQNIRTGAIPDNIKSFVAEKTRAMNVDGSQFLMGSSGWPLSQNQNSFMGNTNIGLNNNSNTSFLNNNNATNLSTNLFGQNNNTSNLNLFGGNNGSNNTMALDNNNNNMMGSSMLNNNNNQTGTNLFHTSGSNNLNLFTNTNSNSNFLDRNTIGGGVNGNTQNGFLQNTNNNTMSLFPNNANNNNIQNGSMLNSQNSIPLGSNSLFNVNNNQPNSLFPNNQPSTLFPNNQTNTFQNQSSQPTSLFPNNTTNQTPYSIVPRPQSNQPTNLFAQNNTNPSGFYSLQQPNQPQQLFAQNQQFNPQLQYPNQNNGVVYPNGNPNPSFFNPQGVQQQGYNMQPNCQPYQIAPNGQPQFAMYPQNGYMGQPQYPFVPAANQQMYPQSYYPQAPTVTITNPNPSFSLFSVSNQGSTFSLFQDTNQSSSSSNQNAEPSNLTKIWDKTLNDYMGTPYEPRANAFRRNSEDISSRLTARFDRSWDKDAGASSRLPYNIFADRRKDAPLKTRNLNKSGTALEMIFSRRNDSLIGGKKEKDYYDEDTELARRPKHYENLAHFAGSNNHTTYNHNASRSSRIRSNSPSMLRGRGSSQDRFQEDVTRVNVLILAGGKERRVTISINRMEKIKWLKFLALKEIGCNDIEGVMKTAFMNFNSRVLKNEDIINVCGIRSEDVVTLVAEEPTLHTPTEPVLSDNFSDISYIKPKSQDHSRPSSVERASSPRKLAHPSLLPILTKPGYTTRPSLDTLRTFTENELKQVDGFVIENENGRIEFEGRTDVTEVNLDELVEIYPKLAEVYPEKLYPTEESKPRVGNKLNKPSYVILYNCFFGAKHKNEFEIQDIMRKRAAKTGAELISYDSQSGTYIIKVPHFTRYEFQDSGDEDEEEEEKTASFQPGAERYTSLTARRAVEHYGAPPTDAITAGQDAYGEQIKKIHSNLPVDEQQAVDPRLSDSIFRSSGRLGEIDSFGNQDIIEERDEAMESENNQNTQSRYPSAYDENTVTDQFKVDFRKRHQNAADGSEDSRRPRRDVRETPQYEDEEEDRFVGNNRLSQHAVGRRDQLQEEEEERYSKDEMQEEDEQEAPGDSREKNTQVLLREADDFLKWLGSKSSEDEEVTQRRAWFKPPPGGLHSSVELETSVVKLDKKLFQVASQTRSFLGASQPAPDREFYLHRSFRVGWSRDGLVKPVKRGRAHCLDINKIILHKDLYEQSSEARKPYREYKKHLKNLSSRTYEPLLKELVNASYSIDFASKGLESMSLKENNAAIRPTFGLEFPRRGLFLKALANFAEHLSNRKYSTEELVFLQEDTELFALVNILFGNPEFDLESFVQKASTMDDMQRLLIIREIDGFASSNTFYSDYSRKVALSRWLELRATGVVEETIQKMDADYNNPDDCVKIIRQFLSAKRIKRANEEAEKADLKSLENLLSSLSSKRTFDTLQKEMDLWQDQRDTNNHSYRTIYELLGANHESYREFEWFRKLGVRLWFYEKPSERIEDIFGRFCDQEAKVSPDILSGWNRDSLTPEIKQKKILDINYILLKMFCESKTSSNEFAPHKVLSSYTRGGDVLNVKHIWIISEFLKKNVTMQADMQIEGSASTVGTPEERQFRYRLLRAFTYQLELLGLWEYAVFAVLVSDEGVITKSGKYEFMRDIVHRNYKTIGRKRYRSSRDFLKDKLVVPFKFINEAKAFKYLSNFIYEKSGKNFLRSHHFQTAHNIFTRYDAPRIITGDPFGEDMKRLQRYLEEIEISGNQIFITNWSKEGQIILLYLKLKELYRDFSNGSGSLLDIEEFLYNANKIQELIIDSDVKSIQRKDTLENIMFAKIISDLLKVALEGINQLAFAKNKKWFESFIRIMPTEFKEANLPSYLKLTEFYCNTYNLLD